MQPFVCIITSQFQNNQNQDNCCTKNKPEKPVSDPNKNKRKYLKDENDFIKKLSKEEKVYWDTINDDNKETYLKKIKLINENELNGLVPLKFKIINSDIDNKSKSLIISKIDQFQSMANQNGEYFKLKAGLRGLSRLPLGVYNKLPVSPTDTIEKCSHFFTDFFAISVFFGEHFVGYPK